MDETFEVITWKQLHTHEKPILLYNYQNYWKHWEALTEHFIEGKFAGEKTRTLYEMVPEMDGLFAALKV